jgi:hypothetical protein
VELLFSFFGNDFFIIKNKNIITAKFRSTERNWFNQKTASSSASEIWAIVTWYDSNGKVVCTSKDTATPRALTTGQTATFDFSWLGSTSRQDSVASYSVMAYSLQYSSNSQSSIIPEFPFAAVLALLVFAGLALTITYKKTVKPQTSNLL